MVLDQTVCPLGCKSREKNSSVCIDKDILYTGGMLYMEKNVFFLHVREKTNSFVTTTCH